MSQVSLASVSSYYFRQRGVKSAAVETTMENQPNVSIVGEILLFQLPRRGVK